MFILFALPYIIYHIKVIGILRGEALLSFKVQTQLCNDSTIYIYILHPAIIMQAYMSSYIWRENT
jgi:uncharacterized membrane protein YobD (UPF0266 family)